MFTTAISIHPHSILTYYIPTVIYKFLKSSILLLSHLLNLFSHVPFLLFRASSSYLLAFSCCCCYPASSYYQALLLQKFRTFCIFYLTMRAFFLSLSSVFLLQSNARLDFGHLPILYLHYLHLQALTPAPELLPTQHLLPQLTSTSLL